MPSSIVLKKNRKGGREEVGSFLFRYCKKEGKSRGGAVVTLIVTKDELRGSRAEKGSEKKGEHHRARPGIEIKERKG